MLLMKAFTKYMVKNKNILVFYFFILLFIYLNSPLYGNDSAVLQTPSEIYIKTPFYNICIWKKELLGGQIHIYDNDNEIRLFPSFYFGGNSTNSKYIGYKNTNNGYKMFLAKAENIKITETTEYYIVSLDFPFSVISYKLSEPLINGPIKPDTLNAKNTIKIYKNTPRIDITSEQEIKSDLWTHISSFINIRFSPFGNVTFSTGAETETEPAPWSKLKFIHKTPDNSFNLLQSDHDEKPPYTLLEKSDSFNDYFIVDNKTSKYFFYCPSWQKYSNGGYTRDMIPDNGILFYSNEDLSNGVISMIIKDTTLGLGVYVTNMPAGKYINNMTFIKLPKESPKDTPYNTYKQLITEK